MKSNRMLVNAMSGLLKSATLAECVRALGKAFDKNRRERRLEWARRKGLKLRMRKPMIKKEIFSVPGLS